MTMLVPDPSTLGPRVNNTATLRLAGDDTLSDWTIAADYRQKSVLGGFANIGGLWTFLNGFFAFTFGSSMLLVMFGNFFFF